MLGQSHPEIPIRVHHLAWQTIPLPIDRNRWAAPQSSEAADWTAGWGQTARKSCHIRCRIRQACRSGCYAGMWRVDSRGR